MKKHDVYLGNIGCNIKERRESLGLSQTTTAVYCGVSLAAYQRWENGLTKFTTQEHFNKLKEILKQ